MSALQYLRRCKLLVSSIDGPGLDLSGLRVAFSIQKSDSETPNSGEIWVYNLAAETAKQIAGRVILQAGYEENFGLIFDGDIVTTFLGRDSGTDGYLVIKAADGDAAFIGTTVNATLAAGAVQADQINVAARGMAEQGVEQGYVDPALNSQALPRGKVMYGMARDYLRQSAESAGASWSIQDNKLQVLKLTALLPDQAVELNSKTGLLGTPELTNEGLSVRCLLNPLIKVGAAIKIDQAAVADARLPDTASDDTANKPASADPDGIYRVLSVEYVGDTRGQDWRADIIALSANGTAPVGQQVPLR